MEPISSEWRPKHLDRVNSLVLLFLVPDTYVEPFCLLSNTVHFKGSLVAKQGVPPIVGRDTHHARRSRPERVTPSSALHPHLNVTFIHSRPATTRFPLTTTPVVIAPAAAAIGIDTLRLLPVIASWPRFARRRPRLFSVSTPPPKRRVVERSRGVKTGYFLGAFYRTHTGNADLASPG